MQASVSVAGAKLKTVYFGYNSEMSIYGDLFRGNTTEKEERNSTT